MPSLHSIAAAVVALALGAAPGAEAQQPPVPPPLQEAGATSFTIFLNGAPIGSEQVAVNRTATGWTIVSSGRLGAPIDAVARRVQVRYTPEWKPLEFTFDGTVRGVSQAIHTVVEGGTLATSEITSAGQSKPKKDTIDPEALLVLPSSFFGPYEALAARLKSAAAGATIPLYFEALQPVQATIGESSAEQIQTASRLINARRTRVTIALPAGNLPIDLWTDDAGRMIRFSVPLQSLEVVREDIAAVSSRSVTISPPDDAPGDNPSKRLLLARNRSKTARA